MRKAIWITGGVVATAIAATAIVAHAKRGYHDHGYDGGGYHNDGPRWKKRWGREMSKEDFDAKTRSKFAKWDSNADGTIDRTEAEARVTNRMERRSKWMRRGGDRMAKGLRRYDTDRDGKVTKAEVEAIVQERFQRIDLDGNGRITDDDLPPFLRGRNFLSGGDHGPRFGHWGGRRHHGRGGRGRGKRMMRHLAGADTNKDGAVTLQELQDRASQRFARFDRNTDGAIDAADRTAFRAQMIDYRVRRFFHRFGAGTDQKVTLEAFKTHRDKRFAKRDIDGDGVIERSERHGGGRHQRWRGRNDERRSPDRQERRQDDSRERAPAQPQ